MFKRKAYERLLAWKEESAGASAMLVEGARRVGKSTTVKEFARAEYDSYVIIDFSLATDDFKQAFLDLRTDLDGFFLYLSAAYGVTLVPRKSLVVFDEVQLFPPAREFIKHLVMDGRYDYVETDRSYPSSRTSRTFSSRLRKNRFACIPWTSKSSCGLLGRNPLHGQSLLHSKTRSLCLTISTERRCAFGTSI